LAVLALVIIFYLSSVIYRQRVTPVLTQFPIGVIGPEYSQEAALYLFLFFSKKDCQLCLLQVIDLLNQPHKGIKVAGIIPQKESGFREAVSTFIRNLAIVISPF